MIKTVIFFVLFVGFISCRSYRMLDGRSRPVYFTPDTSVFNDTDFPRHSITYTDLQNIRGNFANEVELKEGKTSVAIINNPTFFLAYDYFLIYPGEHITITKGKYNDLTLSKIHGSRRRNRELSILKSFHQIENYPIQHKIYNLSIEAILNLEKKLKSEIPKVADTNIQRFDSITKLNRVSRKFKKITRDYLDNRYSVSLYGLYQEYRDTLEAHGLFKEKCRELIPVFNAITEWSKFQSIVIIFNEMANEVLPFKINKIKSEPEFRSCFDFVENNFTAFAKGYLLSQLMYYAYLKKIDVSLVYMAKYNTQSNKIFKKVLFRIKSQQEQINNRTQNIGKNTLLSVDGQRTSDLESLLTSHKGKPIFIDFWATWCAPCREELPALLKLVQEYSEDQIVFFSVSIEREIQVWQKFVIANTPEIKNNFLLINQEKSSFIKRLDINSIPKYILIDKEGQIINTEAPRPSDPKLKVLLNKYL